MDAAFHYLLSAGDDALRLFAIRDAITIYEQAQQFMHEEDWQTKIPLSEQRHLYVQLGRAYEVSYPCLKTRGLCLGSTATQHTGSGVLLWLHRSTHQG